MWLFKDRSLKTLEILQILLETIGIGKKKETIRKTIVWAVTDSIISFRSPVFALTSRHKRVHHPVVATPATIQLLRNHSCSGSVLQFYCVIVRSAEPNPSQPTQLGRTAAGPLEVTCWGQSRVNAGLCSGGLCSQLLTNTRTCHSKKEPRRRLRHTLLQKQGCEFLCATYVVCLCEHLTNNFSWECVSQWKKQSGRGNFSKKLEIASLLHHCHWQSRVLKKRVGKRQNFASHTHWLKNATW